MNSQWIYLSYLLHPHAPAYGGSQAFFDEPDKQMEKGDSCNKNILEALGREFNQLAIEGVLAAPFIDGALETLEQLKKQCIPAFVVSGTPDEEIKVIAKKRNIALYFLEVHGSPRKKEGDC